MTKGKIFEALAQEDIATIRPMLCFVPERLLENGKLQLDTYQKENWDSINAGANPLAVGSHVFPNLQKEITEENQETLAFLSRIKRLIHKTTVPRKIRPPGGVAPLEI